MPILYIEIKNAFNYTFLSITTFSFLTVSVDGENIISIFRNDPNDAPKVINVGRYKVLGNFNNPVLYKPIVVSCDTCEDSNLIGFLEDYVFIVSMNNREDHHMIDIPGKYKTIMRKKITFSDK